MFDLENWLVPEKEVEFNDSSSDTNDCHTSGLGSPLLTKSEEGHVSNATLKYINHILLEDEEDPENMGAIWRDSLALQATEKSLSDALENYPLYTSHNPSVFVENGDLSNKVVDMTNFGTSRVQPSLVHHRKGHIFRYPIERFGISSCSREAIYGTAPSLVNPFHVLGPSEGSQVIQLTSVPTRGIYENYNLTGKKKSLELLTDAENNEPSSPQFGGKRGSYTNLNGDHVETDRSNKQAAKFPDETNEQPDMYDKALLCPCLEPHLGKEFSACACDRKVSNVTQIMVQKKLKQEGKRRGKIQFDNKEVVDLMSILTHCAQAVACNDRTTVHELLKQVKHHASPFGDGIERMAYYIGNAIEARLAGTVRASVATLMVRRLSSAETLKAYLAYILPCPFQKMSDYIANKLIWKLSEKASSLHIIDFGIIHGFQWPRLIQNLSSRNGGPPSLRITGIDFPQPGFRPSERTEETGRLLAYYCKRFKVPFEYNAVAMNWEAIKLEVLKIRKNEVLVVNCLYRLRYVPDETVKMNSPRDAVLNLIKRINPDLFIHGVINGTYNAPFFVTRFRDMLLNFYTAFDMYDAILPREDEGRMLFEREVMGRVAMSVIACEGVERIIRPETYKQWQIRNTRAGLEQISLDHEIVKEVKEKVKLGYHKDFVVDVDGDWMLQGWKGRIFHALSCWKPAKYIEN